MIRTLLAVVPAAAALAVAPPASAGATGQLSLLLQMPLAGQPGSHGGGTVRGSFTGDLNGTTVSGAEVSGSFTYEASAFPCPVTTVGYGTMTIEGAGSVDFSYRRDGGAFTLAAADGSQARGVARLAGGLPCNASQPAQVESAEGAMVGPV